MGLGGLGDLATGGLDGFASGLVGVASEVLAGASAVGVGDEERLEVEVVGDALDVVAMAVEGGVVSGRAAAAGNLKD